MGRVSESLQGLIPAMTQVIVQVALAGTSIVVKLAVSNGMNLKVLIAYRFILASIVIIPLALIVERKDKPKLTWIVVMQAFFCGLLGILLFQNLYCESLVLTSATFVSAMVNIIPAITLLLALCLGSEQLKWKTVAGIAKVIGIFTSIGGAMLLIFYKGADINIWSTNIDILGSKNEEIDKHHSSSNSALGIVLALCFCFSFALGLIIQAKMIKRYPRPYLVTAMTLSMGGIQSIVYALCLVRDWESWKLGWNSNLLAVLYLGIIGSALALTLMTWCIRARGALYVSIFSPLVLVVVAILASLLLDEKLNVGSVLGGGIIVFGLYICLWGMGKELKNSRIAQDFSANSPADDSTVKNHEETDLSGQNIIKGPTKVDIVIQESQEP